MDKDLLRLAKFVAITFSRDPVRKVGAVLMHHKRIYLGWNKFPAYMDVEEWMYDDKDFKNANILHAEQVAFSQAGFVDKVAELYVWPYQPCLKCAPIIAESGVEKIYCPPFAPTSMQEEFARATELFERNNVEVVFVTDQEFRYSSIN